MSTVDEVKERLNIVDLVGETVKLRRAGKNYTGFCPFHPNTRTPAFVVFPDSGTWRCFGQCNEGGDIFRYVMKKEGWDFSQTLEYLAGKAGVELKSFTPERQAEDEQTARLRSLLEEAVTFYRSRLVTTPAGQAALAYLQGRGLTRETIENFGLGYAPESWDAAGQHFAAKGYSSGDLLAAGLVTERQGGGTYDRFRHRILFPIRDAMGKMAGFGARICNPEDVPKFINSPQTALFDKGRLLYGLDLARKSIRSNEQAVIVEGYLDVIVLHQAGFTNTVSPMGTALTEDQFRLLKKFTRNIVLALDADAAGEKATLRGLEVARQALDHSEERFFDARGLLRHESRLQAAVRITTLPPGMDPDEVALRDPEEWRSILGAAAPVVKHVMLSLAAGRNLEDAKEKSDLAAQVLPLIEDVPDPVERETYRQELARLLKVDERALMTHRPLPPRQVRGARRAPPGHGQGEATAPAAALVFGRRQADTESHSLRILLQKPELLQELDRKLKEAGLEEFSPKDFEDAGHQEVAQTLSAARHQFDLDVKDYLAEHIPASLADLAALLQTPEKGVQPSDNKIFEDLVRTILRLRRERVDENIKQMSFLQGQPEEEETMPPEEYRETLSRLTKRRRLLEEAAGTLGRPPSSKN